MAPARLAPRHIFLALLISAPIASSQNGGRRQASLQPLIPSARQSLPLFVSQDAPVWSDIKSADIVTAPCPDVAHCSEVCVGLDNSGRTVHPSHCTSFNGHGSYTARCCVGTGSVCRQPPCSGKPARDTAIKAPTPPGADALHHLFSSLPLLPSHSGDAPPLRPTVFQEPVERNADPNERECSQLIVVQLKESRRSSGLRDEVLFNGVNCYQVKVPASTVALKFGIRALSARAAAPLPPVYSSTRGWPKGLKAEELVFAADDDDVAYAAPIALHDSQTLFLKLRARSVAPLDYQLWFVQVGAGEGGGQGEWGGAEAAWYSPAEALALDPRSRMGVVVYLVLGAVVGLSLSQRSVQVRPKALPVAYIIWLAFGAVAGHRFYLNRTATAIIWYLVVVGLVVGLALDFTLIHSHWSAYLHHHLLWAALLAVSFGGMMVDGALLPGMARETSYWERAQRRHKPSRKHNRYHRHHHHHAEEDAGSEREGGEEGAVELGRRRPARSLSPASSSPAPAYPLHAAHASALVPTAHALVHGAPLSARSVGGAGGGGLSVRQGGSRLAVSDALSHLRASLSQEAPTLASPASPLADSTVVGEVVGSEEEGRRQ